MDHTLTLTSLMVASAGWLISILTDRARSRATGGKFALSQREKPYWWLAALCGALLLALTLPSRPPFSPGASLGPGCLLGTVLLLVTAAMRPRDSESAPTALLWAGVLAVALPGALWASLGEKEALTGSMSGFAVAALLLNLGQGEKSVWSRAVLRSAIFTLALGAAALLGLYRTAITINSTQAVVPLWSNAAVLIGVVCALAMQMGELLTARIKISSGSLARAGSFLWDEDAAEVTARFLIVLVVALLGSAVVALRVLDEPVLAGTFGVGLVAGTLVLVLSAERGEGRSGEGRTGAVAPLAAIVMLGGFMAGFGYLQGYGAAILTLGAAVPLLVAPPARAQSASRVLLFGVALVLYRLFAARYHADLRSVSLADNYALFATAAGFLLPQVPALYARDGENGHWSRAAVSGLLAAVAPAVLILFYGTKVGLSLMVGLALGSVLRGTAFTGLWAVLMGLSLIVATGHLEPLANLTRDERLKLLVAATCGAAIMLIVADLSARMKRR